MEDLAIRTTALRKVFGRKVAVEGLTLDVRRGEVFGFLGPNGAGKSTFLKMLLGLVAPTSGRAEMLGRPAGEHGVRAQVGFLPEHFRFHDWLSAAEFLRLHGRLYRMSDAAIQKRVPALLELTGLGRHAGQQLREFSKGMLQRIGLAQALLPHPSLIFLDEPTSGLDPVGRLLVRDIIREERNRGATVFLNSHLLSEVEITCDRVAFIKHGRVLEVRDPRAFGEGAVTVEIRGRGVSQAVVDGLAHWGAAIRENGECLTMRLEGDAALPEIARYLVAQGVELLAFTPRRLTLEEQFIRIVGTDGGL